MKTTDTHAGACEPEYFMRDGKLTRYLDTKSLTILLTELFMPDDLPPAWLSAHSTLLGARARKQKEDGDEG